MSTITGPNSGLDQRGNSDEGNSYYVQLGQVPERAKQNIQRAGARFDMEPSSKLLCLKVAEATLSAHQVVGPEDWRLEHGVDD